MYKLGIIGSCGRRDDKDKISLSTYNTCCSLAQKLIEHLHFEKQTTIKELVSGGAAFSDHIAVNLFINKIIPKLTLHLPVEWDFEKAQFLENADNWSAPGNIANYYHKLFQKKTGIKSFHEIQTALEIGAEIYVTPGFKSRNTRVANDSDHLLAFTFGNGGKPKDGGTLDTCDKFALGKGLKNAYHVDLHSLRLYKMSFK